MVEKYDKKGTVIETAGARHNKEQSRFGKRELFLKNLI